MRASITDISERKRAEITWRTSAASSSCSRPMPAAGGARRRSPRSSSPCGSGTILGELLADDGQASRTGRAAPAGCCARCWNARPSRSAAARARPPCISACDVFVADVANDPHWAERRQVVLDCGSARRLVHAHQGRQRQVVRLGGHLPPGARAAGRPRAGAHGARRAARGAGHRAQPRRRGVARQRSQVPRPVRRHRGRRVPEHARRPAGVGQQRLREDARLRLGRRNVRVAER